MPRTFWKNILRLIRTTKSRFFSMTAIVAIGVAFFIGVYSSSTIMSASVDKYDDAYGLQDIQIYSNYGFDENDIEAIENIEEVEKAEGSKFVDVVAQSGTATYVTRIHSYREDQEINTFKLVEGRMPANDQEVLAESGTALSEVFPIGTKITVSRPDDDLDTFLDEDTFTVVGLIDTPVYLNFTKGSSTLSNQQLMTYLYVPETAFSMEYDLEVDVITKDGASYNTFSDDYETYTGNVKDEIETLAESQEDALYDTIKADALEQYNDGLREYRDGAETFREEISDAEKQLEDAEKEIDDGKAQLADGIKQLQDSEQQLAEGKQQLADGEQQLLDSEQQLNEQEATNRKQLEDAITQINDGLVQIEDGITQLSALPETRDSLVEQRNQIVLMRPTLLFLEEVLSVMPEDAVPGEILSALEIDESILEQLEQLDPEWDTKTCKELLETLHTTIETMDSGLMQIDDGMAQIDNNLDTYLTEEERTTVEAHKKTITDSETIIANNNKALYDDMLVSAGLSFADGNMSMSLYLDQYAQLLEIIDAYGTSPTDLNAFFDAVIADLDTKIEAETDALEKIRLQVQKQVVEAVKEAIPSAYGNMPVEMIRFLDTKTRSALDGSGLSSDCTVSAFQSYLNDKMEEESTAISDALSAKETAEQSLSTIYSNCSARAVNELNEQKDMLNENLKQAEDGLVTLEATIADARQQILDGWAEIEANRKTLTDGEAEIASGWQEIEENQAKLADGEKELEEGRAELEEQRAKGQQELDDALAELKDAKEEIDALEENEWTVLDRTQHYATASFSGTIDQMAAIGRIFPLFFIMVAVLVCFTTMARTVEEQRTEIGVLRALGYSQMQCAAKYLIYAAIATILGEIIGAVVGIFTFPVIIYNTWKMMYILPEIVITMDWGLLALTDIAFLVVMLLSAWLTCKADMKEVPAQLLRPKSPKLGKNMLIEKITPLWKRVSFTDKVTIRNIFRDKKRFVMTVIGVAGCAALLVTGFGVRDSVTGMVDLQYSVITQYDGFVSIDDLLTNQQAEALKEDISSHHEVEAAEMIYGYTAQVYDNDDTETSVTTQIFQDNEQLSSAYLLRTRQGHDPLTLTDDGVIISEKLSELLDVKTGDMMRMEDETGNVIEVRIAGICEMYIDHYCFMSEAYYESVTGEKPLERTILIKGTGDSLSALQSELGQNEDVTAITFFEGTLESFQTMVSSLDIIVWTIIISSMALAFVVLGNLINVNISERQREIATLKVLGFQQKEVQKYIYKENNVLTFCGAITGVPLGIWLHRTIMLTVEMDYIMFGRSISLLSMVISVALTLLFGILVDVAMRKRLRSIEMVESLKSVE